MIEKFIAEESVRPLKIFDLIHTIYETNFNWPFLDCDHQKSAHILQHH